MNHIFARVRYRLKMLIFLEGSILLRMPVDLRE